MSGKCPLAEVDVLRARALPMDRLRDAVAHRMSRVAQNHRQHPGAGRLIFESSSRSILMFKHDLRANASRLSRGKTGSHLSGSCFSRHRDDLLCPDVCRMGSIGLPSLQDIRCVRIVDHRRCCRVSMGHTSTTLTQGGKRYAKRRAANVVGPKALGRIR
jgi:hypothetical protein